MSDSEAFQLVTTSSHHKIFDDYEELRSGHAFDQDTSLQKALRGQYPELALTVTSASNVSLLAFAAGGNATAELDIVDEAIQRYRYFYTGNPSGGIPDQLVESRTFAKYNFKWGDEYFIIYIVSMGYSILQYVLKEPAEGETVMSGNSVTDKLITTIGKWQRPADPDHKYIYVFDQYWSASRSLYDEVQKASWDDVILNDEMKKTVTELMQKFFDSEDIYKELGVQWKRGIILHGPAGNGKTISIKALMHTLMKKYGDDIPSLYVKSAPQTYHIRSIFQQARYMAPCLLIFEDIDTIVTPGTRSYFFNEVDGLENNDGIFMVASTNHLDQLDPGLSSRPSRFDRKYLFPLPSTEERVLYCDYWRAKLASKSSVKFPKKLCPAIAGITQDFSFAYLKEAFLSTLLAIAFNRSEDGIRGGGDDEGGDLDDYELWREIKKQVKLLRDDMDSRGEDIRHNLGVVEDLSWKDFDRATKVIPGSTLPTSADPDQYQLPYRTAKDSHRGTRRQQNPRLIGQEFDCDARQAPLMTDSGFFIDSRLDRNAGLQLL